MASTSYVNDGANRALKSVFIHDGSAVRNVKEVWVHDGTTARRVYTSRYVVETWSPWNLYDHGSSPNASATLTFNSDGTVAGSWLNGSGLSTIGSTRWLVAGAPRGTYYIRARLQSGEAPDGSTLLDWWYPLIGQFDSASWTQSVGNRTLKQGVLAFDIATNNNGSEILLTAVNNVIGAEGSLQTLNADGGMCWSRTTNGTATATLYVSGRSIYANPAGTGSYTTGNSIPTQTAAVASNGYVRATVVSGFLIAGSSTGVWLSIGSNPFWTLGSNTPTFGLRTTVLFVEFANTPGGTVMAQGNYTLQTEARSA